MTVRDIASALCASFKLPSSSPWFPRNVRCQDPSRNTQNPQRVPNVAHVSAFVPDRIGECTMNVMVITGPHSSHVRTSVLMAGYITSMVSAKWGAFAYQSGARCEKTKMTNRGREGAAVRSPHHRRARRCQGPSGDGWHVGINSISHHRISTSPELRNHRLYRERDPDDPGSGLTHVLPTASRASA